MNQQLKNYGKTGVCLRYFVDDFVGRSSATQNTGFKDFETFFANNYVNLTSIYKYMYNKFRVHETGPFTVKHFCTMQFFPSMHLLTVKKKRLYK